MTLYHLPLYILSVTIYHIALTCLASWNTHSPSLWLRKCYWKCALNCLNLECILRYPRYKIRMQIHLRLLHYGSFLNFELPPSKITSFLLLILRFANSIHVSVNNLFSVWNPWELIFIWTNTGEYEIVRISNCQ